MKILQLELTAFGLFTQTILHFSPTTKLHIIYGKNEAGKSSTRRAVNALLFGIPERTTDAYLHASDKLRLGAHLQDETGKTLVCYRRKGRKNTLNDLNNQPIDEAIFQKILSGITEAQFNALFCFDHTQLRQGGENLLTSGGQIGESLFEAGSGNLQLHELINQLEKEADDIFKLRGSVPKLNKIIQNYKKVQHQINENSLLASHWQQIFTQSEESKQQHTQLDEKLLQLRTEEYQLSRIHRALPLLQRRKELKNKLAELQEIVLLPDNSTTKRIEINLTLSTAQIQEKQSLDIINSLKAQCQTLQISDTLLSQKTTIEHLRERLGSHLKAAHDLPGVRTEMRTIETETQKQLQRIYPNLTLKNLNEIQVTNQQQEQIRQLADNYPALQEKYNSLLEQHERLTQQLTDNQQQLAALPILSNPAHLKAALNRALKQGNLEEIISKTDKEVRLSKVKAEITLKQMGLWQGNLTTLVNLVLPSIERIDQFEQRFKDIAQDKQRVKERLLEARQRHNRASQDIDTLRFQGEIPTEQELTQIRQQRQQQWQHIKNGQSSSQLYHSFENSVLRADETADRLRREAQRVAEQAHLLAEQQHAAKEQAFQATKWHKAEEIAATIQKEWEECWKPYDIHPWSLKEMRVWLTECMALRNELILLQEKQEQLASYQQSMQNVYQELTQALAELSDEILPQQHLDELLNQATQTIEQIEILQRQREDLQKQLKNIKNELKNVEKSKQVAEKKLQQWQIAWNDVLRPLIIPKETEPKIARHILDNLEQIYNKVDKINSLKRRIDLMERDAEIFRQDVKKLIEVIAIELIELPVEQAVPNLSNRLNQIEKAATRLEQLQQNLATEQQRYTKAQATIQTAQAQLQTLLNQAHCQNIVALEQMEQASIVKKTLQRESAEVEQRLLELGEGMSLLELENSVVTIDINQLPAKLDNYREKIQQLEQQRSENDRQIGQLQQQLNQMDGSARAAQFAEEAQSMSAECVELGHRYMQLHLARLILQTTIENYRKQHQAPLLKRANELFRQLTLQQFHGLCVGYQYQTDQPILLAIRNENTEGIQTISMSDGTRDQLYLALRLASIEHYLTKNTSFPLILDDILINFDDQRAQATLQVLGELAQKNQILFFTHHVHLVELAKKSVAPEQLMIHELTNN